MSDDHLPVADWRVEVPGGGSAAVWHLAGGDRSTPVLLLPGFGRRMRHMAAVARQLSANGFPVYRTDLLNHVGLSDGGIERFTMSAALAGIRAVLADCREREGAEQAIIVASSLSFRLAIRLAAEGGEVRGIVGLVGVVDTRYTLAQAFGADFFSDPPDRWPEFAEFERHRISARPFGPDCLDAAWLELEDCTREIEQVPCPIVDFCGREDRWVRLEDISRAFGPSVHLDRDVVEIPDVEHELGRNPAAVNEVLREIVRYALAFDGASPGAEAEIVDLSFDQMAGQAIFERRYEERPIKEANR